VNSPIIDLERFLPYRLSVLANVLGAAIASAYEDRFGLTIPEWRVIAVLTRYPGLAAREVAEKTRMDAVAVSRAVNKLIKAGRIRRGIASDDRRRSVLHVSAAGATVYREVAPLAMDFERALLDALQPQERSALDHLLRQLTDRADTLARNLQKTRLESRKPARRPRARRAPS
jgi:DNA-binding MarR family transcriptional regulator